MLYFSVFLTALFTSMVLVTAMMRLAPRLGLVDRPDPRKVHATVIPRVGGIGITVGALAAPLLWLELDRDTWLLLGGMATVALLALLDDRWNLHYRIKFAGQLAAALVVVIPGSVLIDRLSFFGQTSLPYPVSAPLTVLFLMGMTNATNLSDGLDGLAAGLSILSLSCLMVLASMAAGAALFIAVALAVIGATLGFLRYNTHPAMVFMGDCGSQFLGFSLGALSIWLSQRVNTAIAPELPLLILGLPIIDTVTVMVQRILAGRSPFLPDRSHFHHKLLELGFDHYQVVVVIYAIQGGLVTASYFFRYQSAPLILGFDLSLALLAAVAFPVARRRGWRLTPPAPGGLSRFSQTILRSTTPLLNLVYYAVCAMIGAYLLAAATISGSLAREILSLCAAISVFAILCRVLRLSLAIVMLRLTLYTCALLATYAANIEAGVTRYLDPDWHNVYFAALVLLIAVGVRFSDRSHFRLTPSDYLMVVALLLAGNLPFLQDPRYSQLAMEAAVTLYGVEYALNRESVGKDLLLGIAVTTFAVIGVNTA